jgi:hypothetical protein
MLPVSKSSGVTSGTLTTVSSASVVQRLVRMSMVENAVKIGAPLSLLSATCEFGCANAPRAIFHSDSSSL